MEELVSCSNILLPSSSSDDVHDSKEYNVQCQKKLKTNGCGSVALDSDDPAGISVLSARLLYVGN